MAQAELPTVIGLLWLEAPLAYGLCTLALLGVLYALWRLQLRRIQTRHALEMTRFEAARLQEVNELKSRFFANISHDFRTPLMLVLGSVKRMWETTHDLQTRHDLGVVHKNALRMSELVNQLLDLSRLESGSVKLRAAPVDVVPLLKGLVQAFCAYAERKSIDLDFTTAREEIPVYLDREHFQKIIVNILGNAFKFTPEGGRIQVAVARENDQVSIRVSDTGFGIPADKLSKIFDRFYQVDSSHAHPAEGTGIGLSLTRELVKLHKGSIGVDSEEGKGSTFTVRLPLGNAHLKPGEIVGPEEKGGLQEEPLVLPPDLASERAEETGRGEALPNWLREAGGPVLLIVEENWDVRQYIRQDVEPHYHILEAADGVEGWRVATEEVPDIVVSDVTIPKLDGFTLCRMLKEDHRTSHIPFVLLTARAAGQDRLEGLERWADDYVIKPFEPAELKVRLLSLLERRRKLHEHFKKHGLSGIDTQKINPADRKFLQKAVAVITDHLSDTTLGVESLADELAVSRSVLLKKIQALVGEAPCELIRRVRLTAAAKLLESGSGTISEIAMEVGFTNPSFFAECFKQQFGVTPARYHHTPAV